MNKSVRSTLGVGIGAVAVLSLGVATGAVQERGAGPVTPPIVRPTSADARLRAFAQHEEMERTSRLTDVKWRAVGPLLRGGRIEAIAVAPGRTSTIYAGAGAGNVWKSVNNGTTWTPIFEKDLATPPGNLRSARTG